MLLSIIGESPRFSRTYVRTLAKLAPLLGYKVRPDTIKQRIRTTDGRWLTKANGTCVYRLVGMSDRRFFLSHKNPKRSMFILTARNTIYRDHANTKGATYLSRHRGYLTIAKELSQCERFMWDVQNRDMTAPKG